MSGYVGLGQVRTCSGLVSFEQYISG